MSFLSNFKNYVLKGLNPSYYFRNFILIAWCPLLLLYLLFRNRISGEADLPSDFNMTTVWLTGVFLVVSWLLYPYARFVYESVVSFIVGQNVFFVNAALMLITKLITMLICYYFAILISPLGFIYLYIHFSRLEKQQPQVPPQA